MADSSPRMALGRGAGGVSYESARDVARGISGIET